MNPIKPNTKIRILSPEHFFYVQDIACNQGFIWAGCGKSVKLKNSHNFIFFYSDMRMTHANEEDVFEQNRFNEIFIDMPDLDIEKVIASAFNELLSLLFDIKDNKVISNDITEKQLQDIVDKTKEKVMNTQSKKENTQYPDFDFKIDLSNMNEDQREAAKQWIKDAALARFDEPDVSNLKKDSHYYWIETEFNESGAVEYSSNDEYFKEDPTPEITLNFTTQVSSWSLDNRPELLRKKAELEQKLKEINEMLGE